MISSNLNPRNNDLFYENEYLAIYNRTIFFKVFKIAGL